MPFPILGTLTGALWLNLRLADGDDVGIVPRMSSRGAQGPTGWQRIRALFELTPQERLVVFGVLVVALVALGVRAWILQRQRAEVYQPAGVTIDTKDKR